MINVKWTLLLHLYSYDNFSRMRITHSWSQMHCGGRILFFLVFKLVLWPRAIIKGVAAVSVRVVIISSFRGVVLIHDLVYPRNRQGRLTSCISGTLIFSYFSRVCTRKSVILNVT